MVFFVGDIIIVILHFLLGQQNPFFNLDWEYNLPNFYSGLKYFILASLGLFFYQKFRKPRWLALGLLFLYGGFDDIFTLHETLGSTIFYKLFSRTTLANFYSQRLIGFSWYSIFILPIIITLIFLLFIWKKDLKIKNKLSRYFLEGIVCFGLALILEPIGSIIWSSPRWYQLEMILEETLELFGQSFLLSSLWAYQRPVKRKTGA